MATYEQLDCIIQELLQAGYLLSTEIRASSKVGTLQIAGTGPRGLRLKLESGDTEDGRRIAKIFRFYASKPQGSAAPSEAVAAARIVMKLLEMRGIDFQQFQLALLREIGNERDGKLQGESDGL